MGFPLCVLVIVLGLSNPSIAGPLIDLRDLAKKTRPAVVSLSVSDIDGKQIGAGTGFLISRDGKLVTNRHVIEKASRATARSSDGEFWDIQRLIAEDKQRDLVLLQLDGHDFPSLSISRADEVEPGTRIAVIGSPMGLDGTLSEGIVSAVREIFGCEMMQITAPISSGSSGSPVLNGYGEVIGVASGQFVGDAQSLNFAIPAKAIRTLLANSPDLGGASRFETGVRMVQPPGSR